MGCHLLRGSRHDNLTAFVAPFGIQINDPVRAAVHTRLCSIITRPPSRIEFERLDISEARIQANPKYFRKDLPLGCERLGSHQTNFVSLVLQPYKEKINRQRHCDKNLRY